jgi:hypothetical protein
MLGGISLASWKLQACRFASTRPTLEYRESIARETCPAMLNAQLVACPGLRQRRDQRAYPTSRYC